MSRLAVAGAHPAVYAAQVNGLVGMVPANYVRIIASDAMNANEHEATRAPASRIVQSQGGGGGHKMEPDSRAGDELEHMEHWGGEDGGSVLEGDKSVHERLYENGISQIRRHQHMQEQQQFAWQQEVETSKYRASERSRQMASRRGSDGANYGEFLYQEGLARRQMQEERRRLVKEEELREESSQHLFSPQISPVSRQLRRDMPVVERLLMLDQVKMEKLEKLKLAMQHEVPVPPRPTPPSTLPLLVPPTHSPPVPAWPEPFQLRRRRASCGRRRRALGRTRCARRTASTRASRTARQKTRRDGARRWRRSSTGSRETRTNPRCARARASSRRAPASRGLSSSGYTRSPLCPRFCRRFLVFFFCGGCR